MTDTKWINETASRYGKGGDPSIHRMMKVAIEAERERCAECVMRALREIGATPASSIDSALALVLRKIHYDADG